MHRSTFSSSVDVSSTYWKETWEVDVAWDIFVWYRTLALVVRV